MCVAAFSVCFPWSFYMTWQPRYYEDAFGLSPEMALALSLLKRARDLTIGLPVLAWWQVVEGGRLSRRMATKSAARRRPRTTEPTSR